MAGSSCIHQVVVRGQSRCPGSSPAKGWCFPPSFLLLSILSQALSDVDLAAYTVQLDTPSRNREFTERVEASRSLPSSYGAWWYVSLPISVKHSNNDDFHIGSKYERNLPLRPLPCKYSLHQDQRLNLHFISSNRTMYQDAQHEAGH